MKRSDPWKNFRNIQKTFAACPTPTPVKRLKRTNKKSENKIQSNCSDIYQIDEYSDEENIPHNNKPIEPAKKKFKSPRLSNSKKYSPLNITLSKSDKSNSSTILSDETDDSIDDEQELHDVSTSKSINYRKRIKASSKSLTCLEGKVQYPLTTVNKYNRCTPKNETSIIQDFSNIKKTFGEKNISEDLIIETASETDTEDESYFRSKSLRIISQKSQQVTCETSASYSNLSGQIEYQSTQSIIKSASQVNKKLPRPKKCIKNGLVEALNKIISKTKSDQSFWINDRLADLVQPGEKLCIEKISESYGRILMRCSNGINIKKTLCFDPSNKKIPSLQIGKTIEVCFDSEGYKLDDNEHFYTQVNKILS